MKKLLFFAAAASAWAACSNPYCSAVLPTSPVAASISSASLGMQSMRWEYRIHGFNWSATNNTRILDVGGFGIQHLGATNVNQLYIDSPDTLGVGTYAILVNFAGSSMNDLLIRVARDVGGSQLCAEVFDTQTGVSLGAGCTPISSFALSGTIQGNGISLGGTNVTGDIAFIRWYGSIVSPGVAIPVGTTCTSSGVMGCAGLGDWEFDTSHGTPNDYSGLSGQNFGAGLTYDNTPVYDPNCDAGPGQSVKVGQTITENWTNSTPLDGGTTLTFMAVVVAGSDGVNRGSLANSTTSTPTLSGLSTFGSANVQVTCTDSSTNHSVAVNHSGAEISNSQGVIDLTAEGLDATSQKLIGPLIALGANPYPFADSTQVFTANQQIDNLANFYTDYWKTSLGSASITAGSNIFTVASGGEAPCGGSGSTPLNSAVFIWQYAGTDALTHYTYFNIISCNSATSITVSFNNNPNYPASPNTPWPTCSSPCTGAGYGWNWGFSDSTNPYFPCNVAPQCQWAVWTYNQAPGDYYDNVKSFEALYLRSGIDTYYSAWTNLADDWWAFPVMDQGYNCYSGVGTSPNFPPGNYNQNGWGCWATAAWRSMALTGVYLRALNEGPSSPKWAGLRVVAQTADYYLNNEAVAAAPFGIDAREYGYAQSTLAMCALTDPNSLYIGYCKAATKATLANVWTPNQRSDMGNAWGGFYFQNQYSGNSTSISHFNGGITNMSACATNGINIITGVNTLWVSQLLINNSLMQNAIWLFTPAGSGTPASFPTSNGTTSTTVGDGQGYLVTGLNVGTQTATLSTNYQGTTGCGKGFIWGYPQNDGGFLGWGMQPTYMGHSGQAFGLSAMAMTGYDAPSELLFNQYMDDAVQVVISSALNPGLGGLYNNIFTVGCAPPISPSNLACYPTGSTPSANRSLALELPRAFALDYKYLLTANPTSAAVVKSTMNLLMAQMWCSTTVISPSPGCTSDGNYISDYQPPSGTYIVGGSTNVPPIARAPKWMGQGCGYTEACDMWPAARLAGSSSPAVAPTTSGTTSGTDIAKSETMEWIRAWNYRQEMEWWLGRRL